MAKEEIQLYKKSINESAFSSEQIAMIWDFYVTKSIAASASQKRTAKEVRPMGRGYQRHDKSLCRPMAPHGV